MHPSIKNIAWTPAATETRFVKANVRKQGAQGRWQTKTFETTVPVTGSYHVMADAAIADINKQGWEVRHIIGHSARRDCV